MKREEKKALVQRFYAEMDAGNVDAMNELVAEDHIDHNPPPLPGLPAGREGLKDAFGIFWKATPGRHEIEDQVAEGDKVVTRLTAVGRHEGELPGPLPATGAEMRQTAVAIHRIADGKIAKHWSDRDDLRLIRSYVGPLSRVFYVDAMKERGLLPLPAAPPSGMLGSVEVAYERARRPLDGSVCRKAVCGNRSASTPDGDRPDHGKW